MKFFLLKLLSFSVVFFIQRADSLSSNDTNFRIYKGNVNNYITTSFNNFTDLLKNTEYFDKNKLTIVYHHGYTETVDEDSPKTVMSACVTRGDINCIAADWALLAALPYFEALSKGLQLGADSAYQLNKASDAKLINLKNMRLVGHSLGAHVDGSIGRTLITKYQKTISRITGLDPAGPGFYLFNKPLSKGDAAAVDIIHTDTGINILGLLTIPYLGEGIVSKTGDADFFPNNGVALQPGCTDELSLCSHQISTYFYAESLSLSKANSFISRNALSYSAYKRNPTSGKIANMGFYWSPTNTGVYYLKTNPAAPLSQS